MKQDSGETSIRIDMTPSELRSFLEKLAYDDDFRQQLSENPTQVLSEHHIELPQELLPDSVTLAPKEELLEALEREGLGRDFLRRPDLGGFDLLVVYRYFAFMLAESDT